MIRGHIKELLAGVLALIIAVEIGYIVKLNIIDRDRTVAEQTEEQTEKYVTPVSKKVIVIDPGHGKPSSLMTAEEKTAAGWVQNSAGSWGEWRHFKIGSGTEHCEGEGCNGRVTPNGACWYPIGNGDRNTEPDINLQNALVVKKHLEARGYTVRMTRTSNEENPSITRRLTYCYPDNDTSKEPDAIAFICIHSNASGIGASGTAYISAMGAYDQKWINESYVDDSNMLGKKINDKIINSSSLEIYGSGMIAGEPELIAFCKSPVPCAYLEIGFFDNPSDLTILQSESENIGKAIAEGVDEFCLQR